MRGGIAIQFTRCHSQYAACALRPCAPLLTPQLAVSLTCCLPCIAFRSSCSNVATSKRHVCDACRSSSRPHLAVDSTGVLRLTTGLVALLSSRNRRPRRGQFYRLFSLAARLRTSFLQSNLVALNISSHACAHE